mgnify:CR=1 FL=1
MSHRKSADNEVPIEELTYEEAFAALEEILALLEANKQSLEDAMRLYERGQLLARRCMTLLEQAELKVRRLSGEELVDYSPDS